MRLTLVISSLTGGGAERALCNMANYWVVNGREVTVITLASETTDFYTLHPKVKRVALGLMAPSVHLLDTVYNTLRRLKRLRMEISSSRPDVVIGFMPSPNVLTILASTGLRVPVIVSEHIDPRQLPIGRLGSAARYLLYPRADAVIVQTEPVRRWAEGFIRSEAIYTIPYFATPPVYEPGAVVFPLHTGNHIMAMGRLDPQKGFDLLMRAFALCAAKHTDWSVEILGEGAQREELVALAKELGIADRVNMRGLIAKPSTLLRQGHLFVLSSRFEGFPNALLEAMACGLPVVSFDCPTGPREIVRDGVDGILVPPENIKALAAAMDRLMSDDAERRQMASRALEVVERFEVSKVIGMWEAVIEQVLKRKAYEQASAPRSRSW